MSYRHVNFLENSRSMPSREMVLKIANALELSLKNANVLLRSAGFAPSYESTPLDDESMAFAKTALNRIMEHQNPYPGIVMTPIGGLLMANSAVFNVMGRFVPLETLQRITNIYEFFLTNDTIKTSFVNWDQLAPRILRLIRQEVFEIDTMSEPLVLLKKLEEETGINSASIDEAAISDSPIFNMHFRSGELELRFFSTYTTFGTPYDVALQEMRIECFYPADQKTIEFCQEVSS